MLLVSFYTFGCKLNQLETEAVSDAFCEAGFTVLPWMFSGSLKMPPGAAPINNSPPVLCIINTCTVTSRAEQKARRIIRQCLESGCIVLVTGCYAQLEKEALKTLEKGSGALFVFPGQSKEQLLDLPQYLAEKLKNSSGGNLADTSKTKILLSRALSSWYPNGKGDTFSFNPKQFLFHSRAFLKIQDGCDGTCAYCRVPLARGKSISLNSGEVLRRLKSLEEKGMAEAVITGVNICQYRDPEYPSRKLPELLRFLLDNTSRICLRLSSLEPEAGLFFEAPGAKAEKTEDFFKVLAHPRIRNHFHLSVQSGSDSVLAAMGRAYLARDILWVVEKLKTIRDDPFLACDIITGFPGETEDDFKKTFHLCKTADFAWIHVFPYSKRPGTRAADVKKGLVSERQAGERLAVLMELAKQNKSNYVRRWQGKTVEAAAESFYAVTDNYIKVSILQEKAGKKPEPGKAFLCKIDRPSKETEGAFDAWAQLT